MFDYVDGSGPIPCKLLVCAEAPAITECQTGIPLTGKTGQEFDNLLRRFIGIQREDVYVTNIIKWKLDEKKQVTPEQYEWMGEVLRDEIRKVNPEVILTLGAMSTHWFLGSEWDMEALNGVPHKWEDGKITVVPSIHPAAMFKSEEGWKGGTAILSWVIEAFENCKRALSKEIQCWSEGEKTRVDSGAPQLRRGNIAIDTETYSDGSPYIVTYSIQEGSANYAYRDTIECLWLAKQLNVGDCTVVLHNALYDLPQLAKLGIYPRKWVDTMQIAFLLETLPLGLKPLAYRLCGMKLMTYEQVMGYGEVGGDLSSVPEDIRLQYASSDADATLRAYNKLLPMFYSRMDETLERDMDIQPMIIAMMERGMPLDEKYLEELGIEFEVENVWLLDEIRKTTNRPEFNPKSAKQVSELIYKKLRLGRRHRIRQTKWGGATDAKTLKKLEGENPLVQQIMQYRERRDLIDKFIDVLPAFLGNNGRIHADISMVRVPQSGRLACSKPNLLAQPVRSVDGRRIRDGFVASEGYKIVSVDLSQIEMRIMAHESQDSVMLEVYKNGGDIHTDTAMRTFGIKDPKNIDEIKHRYPSKRTGFGVIYRITAMGLSIQLMGEGLMEWTEEKCQWLIDSWLNEHPGVREYWERTDAETRRHRQVYDLWGRRKLIPEVISVYSYVRDAGLRKSTNVPMQAGAQGIIKEAMRRIWKEGGEGWYHDELVYPLIQIHDDLVFEIQEDFIGIAIPHIKSIMENVIDLSVPILVEAKLGNRWGSLKKWNGGD